MTQRHFSLEEKLHIVRQLISGEKYLSQSLVRGGSCISMAAVGNPYQNAFAESFMKTLKVEEIYLNDDQTLEDARVNLEHFLIEVYNEKICGKTLPYPPL